MLQASSSWLQPIVGLAVGTGMRRSEILGLRKLDIDSANGRLLLPQTKNGEGRIVYLNNLAMAARYQHLSPAFLGEAVKRLDGVFGEFCYPGVTMIPAPHDSIG